MEQSQITLAMQEALNLTDKDLLNLEADKKGVVFDLATKPGFADAKKEKTECKKITDGINRLAIDGKKDIDEKRHELIKRVEVAYEGITKPLQIEVDRRKKIAEEKAEREKLRTDNIYTEIQRMRTMLNSARYQSVEIISQFIEGVDSIDCAENFDEFTQEAMQVKKEVLAELNILMSGAIADESIKKERDRLREQQAEQDKKQAENDAKEEALNARIAEMDAKDKAASQLDAEQKVQEELKANWSEEKAQVADAIIETVVAVDEPKQENVAVDRSNDSLALGRFAEWLYSSSHPAGFTRMYLVAVEDYLG
jgi:hypothetical protein